MKTFSVGAEFFQADRRKDRHTDRRTGRQTYEANARFFFLLQFCKRT